MSLLHQLLQIRELRERRAQSALRSEREALAQAVDTRIAAASSLAVFQELSLAREHALYADLLAREVKVRDIQDVRSEISQMRVKEIGLTQGLERAQDAQTQQEDVVEVARVAHQKTQRAEQKIIEQIAVQAREESVLIDRAEEADLAAAGGTSDRASVQHDAGEVPL